MLLGITIGVIMVIVASIVAEVRITKERQAHGDTLASLETLGKKIEKHEELRQYMKELLDATSELTHDYMIIAGLLEKEIGREEAWKRYLDKKNEKPKDINELIKEIKVGKGE